MQGLTDYITEQNWEDILIATYVIVADRLVQAAQTAQFGRTRGPSPDYDDAQIITIALAADYWFDGDEEKTLHFLRQYHPRLWSQGIPDTSRFNVRRRELTMAIEAIRRQFATNGGSNAVRHESRPPRAMRSWMNGFASSTVRRSS